MAADNTAEVARLKAAIADMLKRVPPRIGRAGLQETNSYKDCVKAAQKVVSNKRATLSSTQAAYTSLNSFWSAT